VVVLSSALKEEQHLDVVCLLPLLQACAVGGRNSTNMQEYLEKQWTEGLSEEEAIRLTVKTLLEVSEKRKRGCRPRKGGHAFFSSFPMRPLLC